MRIAGPVLGVGTGPMTFHILTAPLARHDEHQQADTPPACGNIYFDAAMPSQFMQPQRRLIHPQQQQQMLTGGSTQMIAQHHPIASGGRCQHQQQIGGVS